MNATAEFISIVRGYLANERSQRVYDGPRLRARRLNPDGIAISALATAAQSGRLAVVAKHGGSVKNSYGYAADTECAVAVAHPDGRCALWFGRAPANKVTLGGAAASCLPCASPLFDARYGAVRRGLARRECAAALDRATEAGRIYLSAAISWPHPDLLDFLRADAIPEIYADRFRDFGIEPPMAKSAVGILEAMIQAAL